MHSERKHHEMAPQVEPAHVELFHSLPLRADY